MNPFKNIILRIGAAILLAVSTVILPLGFTLGIAFLAGAFFYWYLELAIVAILMAAIYKLHIGFLFALIFGSILTQEVLKRYIDKANALSIFIIMFVGVLVFTSGLGIWLALDGFDIDMAVKFVFKTSIIATALGMALYMLSYKIWQIMIS